VRRLLPALLAIAVLPSPAAAQTPADVDRVERAVTELAVAKRSAAGRVQANQAAARRALLRCKNAGPGWARIRAVRVPAQRSLYTRGARTLWNGLNEVAAEGAAFDAYRRPFERFLARVERPFDDPVLQAGADAWRKRMALYDASTAFGTCESFDRLLAPVRQFRANVRADYLAGDLYNKMIRFVPDSRRRAAARHWGSPYDRALRAARERLVALGGNEGYATFFAFGHSLRG
jgi:hypothetical protein